MSVSLDSRSSNPAHYAEDYEPLSTRPQDPPEAPEAYAEGGEVEDDELQLEEWQEPADEPELPDEAEEQSVSDDEFPDVREGREGREAPERQTRQDYEEQQEAPEGGAEQPEAEEGDEEAGGGAGGGGGGGGGQQPTGYGQPEQQQQPEEAPAETGYSPQAQAQPSNPLKEVLDYTREQLGVGTTSTAESTPSPAPTPDAADQQRVAASAAAAQVADASGASGTTAPDQGETPAPEPLPLPPKLEREEPPPILQRQQPQQIQPAQQPTAMASSGPGNPQAIKDYVSGKGAYTQDQMTDLLDRTNQTNPNLGQDGAIHAAFKNLVDSKDIDGASKFVQALRPSYDNVRALMIAAASEGQFDKAMQLAERMNNLIPNGDKVRFGQTPDGQIIAQIQPEDGGPSTRHVLTPEQFARYANSPLSLFDHTAEQGLSQNFAMLTGQPGQPGSSASAAGTQLAQAGGAPAGAAAPPTGYNPQTVGPGVTRDPNPRPPEARSQQATDYNAAQRQQMGTQGGRILERAGVTDPGAGPIPRPPGAAPAAAPPAAARPAAPAAALPTRPTWTNPGSGRPNPLAQFEVRRQPQTGYNNGQGGRPAAPQQESEEMRDWKISMQAWKAFPYDNQLTQRGQFEARLHMQNRREDFEREKRQFRPTGEQKLAQEGLKQQGLNYRAEMVAKTNEFKTKVTSDNAMVRAIMARQTAGERAAFTELVQRQRNWGQDLKNAGKPFPYTEQDLAIMKNAAGTALDNNLLDLRNYRPGSGVIRQDQPQAPQAPQTQQQAPQTQQQAPQAPQIAPSPTRTAPITKPTPGPKAPDLGTYRGDAPPPNWDIPPGWEWGRSKSTGIWEARPPRQGPAAAAPISH